MEAIQFSRQDIEDDIKYRLKGLPVPKRERVSFWQKIKNFFKGGK